MSDPNANHAREALARLEILIVQDIFLTETAYLADIVLPASAFPEKTGTFTNTDRRVQLAKKAVKLGNKIKTTGEYQVDIDLHPEVNCSLDIEILSPKTSA